MLNYREEAWIKFTRDCVKLNMLTCVCRPVSSSFVDKQSIMGAPIDRDQIVVTSEPKTKVGSAKAIVNPNPQVHKASDAVDA